MFSAKTLFAALFGALAANALSSPHIGANIQHRHHALRLAGEHAPVARSLQRRCKPRGRIPKPSPSPSPAEKKEEPKPTPEAPKPQDKPQPKPQDPPKDNNKGNNGGGGGGGAPNGYHAGTNSGQATFYATGMGACGIVNHDSDFITAVSIPLFDNFPGANGNPNSNPICGKKIVATVDGKDVTVTVTDRCEGCAPNDLDFSPSAFKSVTSPDRGRVPMTWHWA